MNRARLQRDGYSIRALALGSWDGIDKLNRDILRKTGVLQ